jgi:hypothetical protein
MSRKSILAIAAVAALGLSTLVATDASARFGGGGGGGGGHFAGARMGGGSFSGGRVSNFSRTTFHPTRVTTIRSVGRTFHVNRVTSINRAILHRPTHVRFDHWRHHHNHWWWTWCRFHHHHHCGGYPWIDVGGYSDAPAYVDTAPQPVVATPAAAVCNNDCDYFLNDQPGCYMAKRAFSTPQGEELRCVKICDQPETDQAPK